MNYILFYFVVFAFLGWVLEVLYQFFNTGKFINRGMLNGPYCPIYAFGAIGLLVFLQYYQDVDNFWVSFVLSVIVGTILELVAGFLINKIFKMRFWDYSNRPFNLGGYICPKFSLTWGFVGAVFSKHLHPFLKKIISFLPEFLIAIITIVGFVAMIVDTLITILEILNLKSAVEKLSKQKAFLRKFSDSIGQDITDNAIKLGKISKYTKTEIENIKKNINIKINQRKQEYEEQYKVFVQNINNIHRKNRRRFRAFPELKSSIMKHREIFNQIRKNDSKIDVDNEKS